jgi:hypothetical protein
VPNNLLKYTFYSSSKKNQFAARSKCAYKYFIVNLGCDGSKIKKRCSGYIHNFFTSSWVEMYSFAAEESDFGTNESIDIADQLAVIKFETRIKSKKTNPN